MAEGDPSDEPLSAAAAERLLVAGKTEQAASTAEMVLRSGRRRTVPPAERSVALSVLIQAFSQLSRFKDLESLLNEAVGGLQELPPPLLLLWAAVGCEAGEAERVASALQLRLTFAKNGKRTMKKSDLSATARMYALEVLGKACQKPDAARAWAKQWEETIGSATCKSILEDLDRISDAAEDTLVSHPSTSGPHQLPSALNLSSSEIHEALAREREGEQDAGGSKGGGGGWLSRCAEEAYGWGRWAAGRLQEATPSLGMDGVQFAACSIAGVALAYAIYCERKPIARALQRASRSTRQFIGL